MPKSSYVDFKAVKEAVAMEPVLQHYGILEDFKGRGDRSATRRGIDHHRFHSLSTAIVSSPWPRLRRADRTVSAERKRFTEPEDSDGRVHLRHQSGNLQSGQRYV